MTRTRIELPEKFDFSTEIVIRVSDLNYGGHMGHDAILPFTQEARVRFLKQYGFSEKNIDGVGLLAADAVIIYKSQGFHGQTLRIDVAVGNFTRKSCDFLFRITDKDKGTEVARAKTCMVFFDHSKQKSTEVPAKFKALFEGRCATEN